MARLRRVELEGGLYHLMARGVERRAIFRDDADRDKFLSLLAAQKENLPFYLYAYCLMSNHFHLLVERRTDDIGRIMHRVLTGYSQYYNRKYRRVGHLFQGRHKAVLCQDDPYLSVLVRYIHLNPVEAKIVGHPGDYPYSGHHAYIDAEPQDLVDIDPVLRRFHSKKYVARERYRAYVEAGIGVRPDAELYSPSGGILGDEEFVAESLHRIGDRSTSRYEENRRAREKRIPIDGKKLLAAVATACNLPRSMMIGAAKSAEEVAAKETLIYAGRQLGATITELAKIIGLDTSTISRRHDAIAKNPPSKYMLNKIRKEYERLQNGA